ncbi:hypothetical protein A9Q86_08095 [Flavobacteriales bacterium 33_180_T64]|nr:hypothetical protein A9Q86_08095 [Flavobacteriales bacterium 33_180_T64]
MSLKQIKYKFLLFFTCFVSHGYSQILFENKATNLGVNVTIGDTSLGNGVSFYDFDNDGWDDITLTSSGTNNIRFFKNLMGTFVEQDFNLSYLNYQTRSVTWIDFDNDGDNDLFVTSDTNGNKLLENLGGMIFQDITFGTGMITSNMFTYGASWGDFNNDGFLDVFLNNRTSDITNKLYKNNGDGSFTDVTLQSGIDETPAFSFCSAFLDINNDGYQDLYVSNDKLDYENKLYKNNGDGTFTDISVSSGTNIAIDAMSVTVGDYNDDGFFDIYVTNNPTGNFLFRNNGDETFQNVAVASGTTFNSIGWGATFLDADNDMDIDLYVSGQFDGSVSGLLSAAFYENNNGNTFMLNTSSFLNDNRESYSNAVGDIDNDGLLDLVVANNNDEAIFLWQNTTVNTSNWIKLKLVGVQSNKNAIGARIEISVNGQKQYRYTLCGEGYLAQNSGNEHFGLGNNSTIDYIKINWPSGLEETHYNISINQILTVTEGVALSANAYEIISNTIYPNPVHNILNVRTNNPITQIQLINLFGKVIEVKKEFTNQLDVSFLSSGCYIIVITTKNAVSKHKFFKN